VDFRGDAESARQTINSWVAERTRQKINDLLPPGLLSAQTRLVLTNAIYFKGTWAKRFEKTATRDEGFYVAPDRPVKVPVMRQVDEFDYFDGGDFQALALPYTGKELALLVLLPRKMDGLPEFEKTLTAAKLVDVSARLRRQKVEVQLPRFQM